LSLSAAAAMLLALEYPSLIQQLCYGCSSHSIITTITRKLRYRAFNLCRFAASMLCFHA
jgi:hypothetical protein